MFKRVTGPKPRPHNFHSASMLSWHVKQARTTQPAILQAIVTGLAFNQLCIRRSLPYLKFGVTKAWESTETENAMHFDWPSFRIFHILTRPAAFVSAWLDIKIPVTPCFILTPCKRDIPHFTYRKI